eukprot:CAMPEP_0115732534 /NCGR_PEP_ID=MMETSP0272-20121206/85175_1 /TAXON_ID=71861 /ORGANISM="Scrippsiella trochoidea, Strain CCMP3099" /LENGTH=48 /DNA_ID= /DNA_START= /DNA_END= /DNA_ORIENTATION=
MTNLSIPTISAPFLLAPDGHGRAGPFSAEIFTKRHNHPALRPRISRTL